MAAKGKITTLLEKAGRGDTQAAREVWSYVYDDLRGRARSLLRRHPHHTLQPTELVNEAFQQLAGDRARGKQFAPIDSHHLFATITQRMKWVLRARWRAGKAAKRGGDVRHVSIASDEDIAEQPRGPVRDLDRVLLWLRERQREDLARLIVLRVQEGLTLEAMAVRLDCSVATVKRNWKFMLDMLAFRERE